jgi:hypothetical protein
MKDEKTVSSTGLRTKSSFQDGKLVLAYDQDVSAALDYAETLRNSPEYATEGIKKSWFHAAHISEIVALKMKMEDGFDVYSAHPKEIAAFLMKNKDKYGRLLTSTKKL